MADEAYFLFFIDEAYFFFFIDRSIFVPLLPSNVLSHSFRLPCLLGTFIWHPSHPVLKTTPKALLPVVSHLVGRHIFRLVL